MILRKEQRRSYLEIDDCEYENLKKICDEVFGHKNYVGTILWKKKTNGNNMGFLPPVHDYIICYAKSDSITLRRKRARVNKNNLYDCYKLYYPAEVKDNTKTEELLSDMFKYAPIYQKIFKTEGINTELDKVLYELIYRLNATPASVFLMYLFAEGHTNEDMLEAVRACISYVFRVRVFNGNFGNQFFASAIQYFERADETIPFTSKVWASLCIGQGSYRFPKDREFEESFKNKDVYLEFKPQMIRYILYRYEKLLTREIVEEENATIEHILPQNPIKWQRHLAEIGDTDYPDLTHKIGNLTLTKYNSEVSNDVFEEKKVIYKESGYKMTRDIALKEDWNSWEIRKRTDRMAAEAIKLWPLPETFNVDVPAGTVQYDVMDDATAELFDQFPSAIKEYDPSVYEDPKKFYVNIVRENKIILSVIPNQSYLSITLNAPLETFERQDIIEDVRNIGHWGVGQGRVKIRDEDGIYEVLECVQQMADKGVI